MRTLLQSWLCFLALGMLVAFSFVTGLVLDCGMAGSTYEIDRLFGGKPLPALTVWFQTLDGRESGWPGLFPLAFYPTLLASAYLWRLLRGAYSPAERHARFALVSVVCFGSIATFLAFGILSLALPFLSFGGPMISGPPPLPPLQQGMWAGLVVLLAVNAILVVMLLLSFRHPVQEPAPAARP